MSTQLRMPRLARRFARDARGVSAVKFALLLPLMMTIYLGGTEISSAIAASRKATFVSRTVADLTSQSANINNTQMTAILHASAAVIAPYPTNKLKVTVSQVKIDADGAATIEWSDTRGGATHSTGASVTVPPALKIPNSWLIWSEAEFTYEPTIGYVVTGPITLKDQMYMKARLGDKVNRT